PRQSGTLGTPFPAWRRPAYKTRRTPLLLTPLASSARPRFLCSSAFRGSSDRSGAGLFVGGVRVACPDPIMQQFFRNPSTDGEPSSHANLRTTLPAQRAAGPRFVQLPQPTRVSGYCFAVHRRPVQKGLGLRIVTVCSV
ncbi:MAG: hypothetical protein BJ554DRAFT_6455, partial [Olpidium bornovanus]